MVVFGRTPEKLAKISNEFGFATTTDLDAFIGDALIRKNWVAQSCPQAPSR